MAYQDAELLRDRNGNPIPQYFNVATGQFEPITGKDGAQNTQLTGSNVEDGLPVKAEGKDERIILLERQIRTSGGLVSNEAPINIKGMKISFVVYGLTGNFSEGEGYSIRFVKESRYSTQMYNVIDMRDVVSTETGNLSGMFAVVYPGITEKKDMDGRYVAVDDFMNGFYYRFQYYISGDFADGEGVDCEAFVDYIY